jgi:MoaA/NifB/PqqE/SkfB family radical SAM enzyme
MFTVNKKNMKELYEVINLVSEIEVDSFDFDRVVPVGSGEKFANEMIEPLEYKELLTRVDEQYKMLKKAGCKTHFGYRDNLWGLLYNDSEILHKFDLLPEGCELERGCLIGKAGLVVLSDGSVMGCRRLPVIAGKVPEKSLIDIFENSDTLLNLKKASEKSLCKSGGVNRYCCGCLAQRYSSSNGDLTACDPQCWIKDSFNVGGGVIL